MKDAAPRHRPALGLAALCLLVGIAGCSLGAEAPAEVEVTVPDDAEQASPSAASGPATIVTGAERGPDLPPEGRSLFDFLLSEAGGPVAAQGASGDDDGASLHVPFPFEALLARIESQLASEGLTGPPLVGALFPLGRSLQRNAAFPDFFASPRTVIAADAQPAVASEGRSGLLLRDRLYLGYVEKAGVVEVISYNEAAARFEFQIVRDYEAGKRARVFYARRSDCIPCHQNHAPLFSREPWDETSANPRVAIALRQHRDDFYGIPVDQGVDRPERIDAGTDRANRFVAYQTMWREGCQAAGGDEEGPACRARILEAMLRFLLAQGQHAQEQAAGSERVAPVSALEPVIHELRAAWRSRWPHGLALPDGDIPNRDPLADDLVGGALGEGLSGFRSFDPERLPEARTLVEVARPLEPFLERPPADVWHEADVGGRMARELVAGLATFISSEDVRRVDDRLVALAEEDGADGPALRFAEFACRVDEGTVTARSLEGIEFRCRDGRGELAAFGRVFSVEDEDVVGRIDRLVIGGEGSVGHLDLVDARLEPLPPVDARADEGSREASAIVLEMAPTQRVGLRPVRRSTDRTPRIVGGERVAALTLEWHEPSTGVGSDAGEGAQAAGTDPYAAPSPNGRLVIHLHDDLGPLRAAIEAMAVRSAAEESDALAERPFRRAVVMRELLASLGMGDLDWCCVDGSGLPPALVDDA